MRTTKMDTLVEGARSDAIDACTASGKKREKKLRKIEQNLSSKEQLAISKHPTRILCVQNGGLGNSVSQAELLPVFAVHGGVDDILMIPRKAYSFVVFTDVAAAAQALHHLNGHLLRKGKDPTQDVVLYLFFVEKALSTVMPYGEKPPGLHIIEDFVSAEVEEVLLKFVNEDTQQSSKDVMKHRKVKHFGFEFKYDINDVDARDPLPDGIPPVCSEFLHRAQQMGLVCQLPDQLTVNQYNPGQGIPPHVDTVDAFEDGIMSLSLGSQVVMDFRHPDGRHLTVLVPRRSLLVMTGESRYVWSHGITPRKSDIVPTPVGNGLTLQNRGVRTSFTFRKVILDRMPRSSRKQDDDETGTINLPENDTEAVSLEKEHVHKVYEDIAEHFSGTRYKPWPRVADFLREMPPSSLVADVGCGNGKYLGINKNLFEIGSDYSNNLASICRSRGFETCVADVTCLPFRASVFDVVLCIAVIHHMSTEERRIKAVSEVVRVLRAEGQALIYVWALEQDYESMPSKYIQLSRQEKLSQAENRDGTLSEQKCTDLTEEMDNHEAKEFHEKLDDGKLQSAFSACSSVIVAGSSSYSEVMYEQNRLSKYSSGQESVTQVPEKQEDPHISAENSDIRNQDDNRKDTRPANNKNCKLKQSKKINTHVNRTHFKEQDILVPWQLKGKQANQGNGEFESGSDKSNIFHRFYHVFRHGELEAVCQRVPGCAVKKCYYDQGNWCVILKKL